MSLGSETESLGRHCIWARSPMQGTETWHGSVYVDCACRAATGLLWAERTGSSTSKQVWIPTRTADISNRRHGRCCCPQFKPGDEKKVTLRVAATWQDFFKNCFILKKKNHFLCVLLACACLCTMCVQGLQRPEGNRPRTIVTDGYDPLFSAGHQNQAF